MKRNLYITTFFLLSVLASGCKKYLQVDPKSSIAANGLFASEVGFQQALNGVYSLEASRDLYGDNLSMGFSSAMAQNYEKTGLFKFTEAVNLNFGDQGVKSSATTIWSAAYNAIAGLNSILGNIDAKKDMFTPTNYALVKGEALGMRAYLHFDILRLFASNYNNTSTKKAIPYLTTLNPTSQSPSTGSQVIALILQDLKDAEGLLGSTDPILQGNKDRHFYMNFLAVKALEARIYLYAGDKIKASNAAQTVINARKFSFVTQAQISADPFLRDRLFSDELVLALRVKNLKDWVESGDAYFNLSSGGISQLTITPAHLAALYETSTTGATDYRFNYLFETSGKTTLSSKFYQTLVNISSAVESSRKDQIVPLIRLSEMYYVLAEAAATPGDGMKFINTVLVHRGLNEIPLIGVTDEKLNTAITKEYQKEFYAEGQLFFYYKRKTIVRMQFGAQDLNETSYILPIPDNELEYNSNYK